ncbi:MAG: hypothetical protein ACYS8Z_11000 [Planctomycetota bacterium]|jgi:hypothetical protein
MSDTQREIQELLADYAEALRDGSIPVFLKSLTRSEGQRIARAPEFWDAAEVVRYINSAGFADKTATPDVGLFISRVDAKIGSRIKKARAAGPRRRTPRPATKVRRTEKTI